MSAVLDPIETAADAAMARAKAEIRLLAAVAPIGRWGLVLADRASITLESFEQDDCRAIFAALIVAEQTGKIIGREAAARLVVESLRLAGLFDPADTRPFAAGLQWGLPAVVALFCRLSRREAEALLPILAADLMRIGGAA